MQSKKKENIEDKNIEQLRVKLQKYHFYWSPQGVMSMLRTKISQDLEERDERKENEYNRGRE